MCSKECIIISIQESLR